MTGRLRRTGLAAGLATLAVLLLAVPAAAHVALVSSAPADRATLSVVPTNLELVFNGQMQPSGPGIVLTDVAGATRAVLVSQPAKHRLIVEPEQRLGDGAYQLSWTVRAGDAHPRSGAVAFTVATGPAASPATPAAAPATPGPQALHKGGHVSSAAPHGGNVEHLDSAEWLGSAARWVALLGALLGIGVLAFAASSLTGSIAEVQAAAFWVRRAGLALAVGTLVELCAAASLLHGAWGMGLAPSGLADALSGAFGVAVLLRLAGGGAMLFGAQLAVTPLLQGGEPSFAEQLAPRRGTAVKTRSSPMTTHCLNVGSSRIALVGAGVVALSYLFDGHTVIAEPAWLVRIADVVHVVGAGVWVGGVAMMAWVLKQRHQRNVALRAGELAVRFSTVAAGALALVAVAGFALSAAILDLPGELFSTGFGRLLLLKMLAVGAAATIGGYNHRYVIPELARSPADANASEKLRTTVKVESLILLLVVGVTAVLVGAST